jgi:hypothetical protein
VAAVGGLGVFLFAPEVKGAARRRLDGIGALGVGVALLALVFGVVGASSAGWSDTRVLQVGGALGAATLTSVFLESARSDYAARLAPTGLSLETIRDVTRAWRKAVGESASTGARVLPEGMERLFEDSFRTAFTVGVARVFAVAALIALVCAVLAWFGIRPGAVAAHASGGTDAAGGAKP